MIDYTSYKKIYTAGDMFTLTASDFHGFVEIDDFTGVATEVSTGKALSSKNTYATDPVSYTHLTLPTNREV